MISLRGAFWCGCLLAWSISPSLDATTVEVVGLQGYVEPALPPTSVFGNREQGVDLDVSNAAPKSGPLMADVFQVTGELSMPLATNVRLQDAVTLTGAPSQRLHVSIKFPDVKQHAQILIRLSIRGTPPQTTPALLGDLHFEVFPNSLTKQLADLLQPRPDGSVPVVLFGAGRKLHVFLGAIGVRFDDAGNDCPETFEAGRLYLGEMASAQGAVPTQEMVNAAHVAIFAPDPLLPAGIYAESRASGVFVQVTQPLLDNLSIDPRAQLALIKVIHLLNSQLASNNPSSL